MTKITDFKPGLAGARLVSFVREVSMRVCEVSMRVCVSAPEAINYILVILNLYNQLNKFITFRNVTKLSMHGCGLCNEVRRDRNQSNKAMSIL